MPPASVPGNGLRLIKNPPSGRKTSCGSEELTGEGQVFKPESITRGGEQSHRIKFPENGLPRVQWNRMHHTLKFYSRNREQALRFYMFMARWTKIPLIGRIVRWVGNTYGNNMSGATLLTQKQANEIVDLAGGLAVGPCSCREVFHNCDHPIEAEIMLGFNRNVFVNERPDDYREITPEEAKILLADSHKRGLIPTIIKCREDYYAICNCCTCCCVPLRLSREFGIGGALKKNPNIVSEFSDYLRSHKH